MVTMLHDYSGKEAINSGNRVGVLDLGGNTFTYLNPDKIIDINYDNAGITIQNGTLTAMQRYYQRVALLHCMIIPH